MKTTIRLAILLIAGLAAFAGRAQNFVAQWDFTNGNLNATVGQPLEYMADTSSGTVFGTTTSMGLPDINGAPANVMGFPKTTPTQGYLMPVPGPTPPGAVGVNDWTLLMDILIPAESVGNKIALLEIIDATLVSSPGAADAEFYFQGGGLGYSGNAGGAINGNTWHRIAIVSDNSNGQKIFKYIDGIKVGEQGNGGPETQDGKWALDSLAGTARLFNDDNDETAAGFVSSIQLRDRVLSPGQVFAIGGPTADGIPAEVPKVPSFPEDWIPASEFANRDADLGLVINAGDTTISDSSIALTLDGQAQTPRISRDGSRIEIILPSSGLFDAPSTHTIEISFTDSVDGAKSFSREYKIPIFYEDFNALPLGPNVDEGLAGDEVWTKTAPDGWTIDDTGVPGVEDPSTDGVTEWAGWSFANREWWAATAGDQQRTQFTKGTGAVLVADPDEWDDQGHDGGPPDGPWYNTYISTPAISLQGVPANAAFVQFDSSWRPEFDSNYHQSGNATVSFDGGAPVEILRWLSDSASPNFKPDSVNETVVLSLDNPAGATSMVLTFGLFDAGNDWWWAIDNLIVNAGAVPPNIAAEPVPREVTTGDSVTFSVVAGGGEPFSYQWYRGSGANKAAIDGATSDTLTIASVAAGDADLYSVEVSNSAGSVSSAEARLTVIESLGGVTLFSENFDGLPLGPNVDEALAGDAVWTKTPPDGWVIDDSGVASIDDPEQGMTEWQGWSIADSQWWAAMAGDQRRTEFTKSTGAAAIADPDEWDDRGNPDSLGTFNSFLSTPPISVDGVVPGSVVLRFNSSFRPEGNQTATVTVAYDGGTPVEVLNYRDTTDDKTNETLDLPLNNPAGAQSMVITFGMTEAVNNWFWAIDNIVVVGEKPALFAENFDGLALGPNVDEQVAGANVWTKTPPAGWTIDDSGVAGINDPAQGVTEWKGWSFADSKWWASVDDQRRSEFTKSSGAAAIADPDEWDDKGNPDGIGTFNSFLSTPAISLAGIEANSLILQFDSSFRPEGNQTASVSVSFDGGAAVELLNYRDTTDDKTNETIQLALTNPAGASSMVITFAMTDAVNNWFWAIDNIEVREGSAPPAPTGPMIVTQPAGPVNAFVGDTVTLSVAASGDGLQYQWFLGEGNQKTEIAGATSASLVIARVSADHSGTYSVRVSNAGGEVFSDDVSVTVNPPPVQPGPALLFSENFNGVPLGPNVDEAVAGDKVWTKTAPNGWMIDDSGVPGAGDPATDGVTEWAGWSFADAAWWAEAAGDQRRSEFTLASGAVAVADPDEWDDAPHADAAAAGWYDTFLSTPAISLAGVAPNSAVLKFDSSWRPEFDDNYHQTATVLVSFDGGDPVEVLLWESDSASANYKDTAVNETVTLALNNPPGASAMVLTFGLFDAGNDWWWAVDNVEVSGMPSLFSEGFEGLPLGPNVDEAVAGVNVWTKTAPAGWVIDDSGVPGAGDPATDGVTEWAGWSFADAVWWAEAAGDQRRSEFTLASGTVAVADPDEWDDAPHADAAAAGWYDTLLSTPQISLAGVPANSAVLQFDSSWRPEFDDNYHQTAVITASFDGGEAVQVLLWESDSSSPNYKDTAVNETVAVPLNNPAGASSMVITFGLVDAGNDWWWAIDNIEVLATQGIAPSLVSLPFMENFDGLALGPNVDEAVAGANVWTKTAPPGWMIDDSGVPGAGDPANDGVTEWAGWSFADAAWWAEAAGDQRRSEFTLASGTVAVADPDEWDDQPHADSAAAGWYDTFLSTPAISLAGAAANSVALQFDSSWRPEFDSNYHQTAVITASFDGGEPVQVMLWESDSSSPNFKDAAVNETVQISLNNPAGASSVVVTFGLVDAGNDWWWAVDNIVIDVVGGGAGQIAAGLNANGQLVLTWADPEARLQTAPGIAGPWSDVAGATSPSTINLDQIQGFYRLVK